MARPIGPTIEIESSSKLLERLERELRKAGPALRKGAARALNRSLRSGKSAASKEIRDVINLKKKPVDKRIDARVISQRALVGKVAVRDRMIPLIEFMTKAQIATAYRRGRAKKTRGVAVKPWRKKGRQVYPGTFVELGRNDRRWHVLKRATAARYPIRIQYGPNLTTEFEKTLGSFAARASEVLQKNLEHEIDYALGRL